MLLLFFHTLVKHGHIAPDYRLQNHIHTCLSHGDALTQMQRGLGGGTVKTPQPTYFRRPLPLTSSCSNFLFFLFFLAKVNLSNHRRCVSLYPLGCTYRRHYKIPPWPSGWRALAALWRHTPWAYLWQTRLLTKHLAGDVLGLRLPSAWHLPSGHENVSLHVCSYVCVCVVHNVSVRPVCRSCRFTYLCASRQEKRGSFRGYISTGTCSVHLQTVEIGKLQTELMAQDREKKKCRKSKTASDFRWPRPVPNIEKSQIGNSCLWNFLFF